MERLQNLIQLKAKVQAAHMMSGPGNLSSNVQERMSE